MPRTRNFSPSSEMRIAWRITDKTLTFFFFLRLALTFCFATGKCKHTPSLPSTPKVPLRCLPSYHAPCLRNLFVFCTESILDVIELKLSLFIFDIRGKFAFCDTFPSHLPSIDLRLKTFSHIEFLIKEWKTVIGQFENEKLQWPRLAKEGKKAIGSRCMSQKLFNWNLINRETENTWNS